MLWKRKFAIIWTGQAVSIFTSSVIQMALIWYLTDKTESAAVLTLGTFLGFLPQAVLGPFIGVLIDRYNRKKIMILSDVFIGGVTLLLAIWGFYGELTIFPIMIVLFLRSVGTAFHNPCLQAVTPSIVPKEDLVNVAGYTQGVKSFSQLLSPAAAAVLYGILKINLILLIDVAGAIFALLTIISVDFPRNISEGKTEVPHLLKETKEGLIIIQREKGMLSLMILNAAYAMIYFPIGSLYPLISMSYFGGTYRDSSIVEVVFAAGTLLGALILGKIGKNINKIRAVNMSIGGMGVGLVITGALPSNGLKIFIMLAGIMGITIPYYHGVITAIYQERFRPEYLGRVLTLFTSLATLSMPVGLVLAGSFAEIIGVEKWFFISGILTIVMAIICYLMPSLKEYKKTDIVS